MDKNRIMIDCKESFKDTFYKEADKLALDYLPNASPQKIWYLAWNASHDNIIRFLESMLEESDDNMHILEYIDDNKIKL